MKLMPNMFYGISIYKLYNALSGLFIVYIFSLIIGIVLKLKVY